MIKWILVLFLFSGCTFNVSFKWERMNPKPVIWTPNVGMPPGHAAAFDMDQKYLLQKMNDATNAVRRMPSRSPKGQL